MADYQKSIYTRLGAGIKRVFFIEDFSLFRKDLKKRVGRLLYHTKYNVHDLVHLMEDMGMKKGSVVCIHSSMKEFYNFRGTAEDLIREILGIIGKEGTLMMPAFPQKELIRKENYVFDPLKDKTGAGYLAETFRKWPSVKRSINVQHSVCAIGRYADYLTKDHVLSRDCWDEYSPWQRGVQLGMLVFNLGMPRSYIGTFHHCVESILQFEYPYWAQFFNSCESFRYYDEQRRVCDYTNMVSRLDRRTRESKVTRFFTSEDWKKRKISNLSVTVFYTEHCFPKMLELGRKGISVYYVPSPRKYTF